MSDEFLPCPYCGDEAVLQRSGPRVRQYMVMCRSCHACNGWKDTAEMAIASWNRRVRPDLASIDSISLMAESVRRGLAEVESSDIPDWLVRRIKNVTYGYKHAGDGWGYRDGYNDAMKWILSLRRGNTE